MQNEDSSTNANSGTFEWDKGECQVNGDHDNKIVPEKVDVEQPSCAVRSHDTIEGDEEEEGDDEDDDYEEEEEEEPEEEKEEEKQNLKPAVSGQKFCDRWLDYKDFRGWLVPVIGEPFKAWCKACRRCLTAGKSELLKHGLTRKHQAKLTDLASRPVRTITLSDEAEGCPLGTFTMKPFQNDAVAAAEIKLAAFAAEHNLMGKAVDHLCELVKELCQNPRLSRGLDLNRFKCGTVIRNVLAKGVQQDLDEELAHKCFSLLIDESVDTPAKKVFCLAVRYFSEARNKVKTEILAELTVNAMEPNAGMMSAAFKDLLDRRGIPFENMIGMAADGASVMIGNPDSLQAMLVNHNSVALCLTCISRSVHIALELAIKVLPRNLEDLLRNLVNYRMQNLDHQSDLKELQQLILTEMDKMTDPNTRNWLLMQPCIAGLLEKMPGLELLFMHEPAEDRSATTELIQEELKNPYTKSFFLFLNYILTILTNMEAVYQSSNVLLPTLIKECQEHFRSLCQHFLHPAAYLDINPTDVSPYEEANLLPLENLFVGSEAQDLLNQLDPAENEVFLLKCREFYQVVTSELKSRLLLPSEHVDLLDFLDPQIALKIEGRANIPSLEPLGAQYAKFLDVTKLDQEWMDLPQYFSKADAEELQKLPLDSLWGIIADMRNEEDSLAFVQLGRLAKITLSLPIPNAEAEQAFALMKETKIKPRKIASSKTLHSLLMVKQAMIQDGTDCRQFTVTGRHLKLFRSDVNEAEEVDEEESAVLADEG